MTLIQEADGNVNFNNLRLDLTPSQLRGVEAMKPLTVHRDGVSIETYKIAFGSDPDFLRAAERDGFFPMSRDELKQQMALNQFMVDAETAGSDDQKEIAELKTERAIRQIDDLAVQRGDTILSALPKWHEREQPRITTRKAHQGRIQVFVDLHGNLPLAVITKRHIVEFVEHVQTMTHRRKPLTATTMSNYLASIAALLNYAASVDLIPFNPAKGVIPPKDNRPKVARSFAAFEKSEIRKLITTGTEIWSNRRVHSNTHETRRDDLITALHMLTWTGARPEEICQLRVMDVDLHGRVLTITNDGSDDEETNRVRFTKNENSVRDIPIHSKLAPIVADHLDMLRAISNCPLLFPSFEPTSETGRYARVIGNEWTSALREHVSIYERKVLYSLRHSWAAESRDSGMPEYVRNALMGHGGDNPVAGRYGGDMPWIEVKRVHLEKMDCVDG